MTPDDTDDTDIICSIKYNEAYILSLLQKSNYFFIHSVFRSGKKCKTSHQKHELFETFIMRYYNTCFPDTAFFCIEAKYRETNMYTKDDFYIKPFKDVFNKTKDDTYINNETYKTYCKYIDSSKYYCDYCKDLNL